MVKMTMNDDDDDDEELSNTSLMLSTGFPSNSITISPGQNPARSAGDPGVT
jgi:hypothetical protein